MIPSSIHSHKKFFNLYNVNRGYLSFYFYPNNPIKIIDPQKQQNWFRFLQKYNIFVLKNYKYVPSFCSKPMNNFFQKVFDRQKILKREKISKSILFTVCRGMSLLWR